jgi:S1-C subfamily serine protease
MQDKDSGTSEQRSPEKAGSGRPGPRPRRRARLVAYVAAGALAIGGAGVGTGLGLGALVRAIDPPGPASAASAIPSPPRQNAQFAEDDDGTGADNQENILAATVPGLVQIVSSRGTPAGTGVILTPSGIVLTSDQILRGAGRVTVRAVLSGRAFSARVIGSDAADDLALVQIEGVSRLRPIAIGNSGDLAAGEVVTAVGTTGTARTFTPDLGNIISLSSAAAVGGRKLAGLLRVTSQLTPGLEAGGPLVNLSGQAIGIDVVRSGSGLKNFGFAIPIDRVLEIARRIAARHAQ